MALNEKHNPEFFEFIKNRNLEQQFFLLETLVAIGLATEGPRFSLDAVLALHFASAIFINDDAGKLRTYPVYIQGSDHTPPDHEQVRDLCYAFVIQLNENFGDSEPFELAAYALWRLTWIHPFEGCNGRTARALCYLVLCLSIGYWPPGRETVLSLMSETKSEAYGLLSECDGSFRETGEANLTGLSNYLKRLFYTQIGTHTGNLATELG